MQSFEIIDIILFLGISQGIFLAVTIQMIQNKNRAANKILSVILLLSVLMLLGRMVFFRYLTLLLFQWSILVDSVIFIFGPLCYIYFRRLAFLKNDNFRLSWAHYLPVAIHLLFFCYIIFLGIGGFSEKLSSGVFKMPFLGIEGVGIVSNFYYWVLNFKLLKLYNKEEKNTVSYKQGLLGFLKFFQVSVGVVLAIWAISFISSHLFNSSIKFVDYNSVWGTISLFIFVIGYYSLKEPELFRIPLVKEKSNPQKRIPDSQIDHLGKELSYVIEKEKMFLEPNLTLRDLSERLNTSTHNISWYLNTICNSSFYDYINHYRIKEFVRKINNNEHHLHTILAISMEVGFNSKSTFNKAFKLEMNDTPSNYIKRLKVA